MDPLSEDIKVRDKYSTSFRRLVLSDTIFLWVGVVCLFLSFYFYKYLNGLKYWTASAAYINVIINFLITKVYFALIGVVVEWENHANLTRK